MPVAWHLYINAGILPTLLKNALTRFVASRSKTIQDFFRTEFQDHNFTSRLVRVPETYGSVRFFFTIRSHFGFFSYTVIRTEVSGYIFYSKPSHSKPRFYIQRESTGSVYFPIFSVRISKNAKLLFVYISTEIVAQLLYPQLISAISAITFCIEAALRELCEIRPIGQH